MQGPQRGDRGGQLQLAVGNRSILKELTGRPGRDHEESSLVEHDDEQERQQPDRREVERDGDGPVIAAVQPPRREVQAGERQAEHQQRLDEAAHRAEPSLRDEIEETASHQQEGAEIQSDLRVGQGAAVDDPVVVSRIERPIGGTERAGFVRMDQPQAQPLVDVGEVRRPRGRRGSSY